MKKHLGKNLLIGAICGCMMLSGAMTLSGCEKKQETNYGVIGKSEVVEIIERARQDFVINNYDCFSMKQNTKIYDGYEDILLDEGGGKLIYRSSNGVKVVARMEDDNQIFSIQKSDFNQDIHYQWYVNRDAGDEIFGEVEYKTNMWDMQHADFFSISTMEHIGRIKEEDINKVGTINGGYIVDIIVNLSTLTDTNINNYDDNYDAEIYYYDIQVEIINNRISKISCKIVGKSVPVKDLEIKNLSTIVLDEQGIPVINEYNNLKVQTAVVEVEYNYDVKDFSQIDAKIAKIEADYLSQN